MNIVCAGDCGVDRYVNRGIDRAGGITLNFAVNARRLFPPGDRVVVITAVGRDGEGAIVLEAIDRFGIEALLVEGEGRTPVQYIEQDESGDRRFVGYEVGVLAAHRVGARERDAIAGSDLLIAPVYTQVVDFFDSVMSVPSRGVRAVDFSDLADFGADVGIVERYLPAFDVGFFGLTPGDRDLLSALDILARHERRLFVVTLGAAGSLALGGIDRIERPALPVPRVVDTTGAGDTFAAGFLSEYCYSRDVARSLEKGNEEAALSIQRVGAF